MAKTPKLMWDNLDELLGATEPPQGSRREEIGCEGIKEMLFEEMRPFPNHRFRLYEGQRLIDMADSIRQMGILLPIILWHTADNDYIILSGHNRVEAGRLAGLTKGPVIIKEDISYEDAVLIVTETNLKQRSFNDLSHSERAYSLAQHYEAMKSQGKRNDLLNEIDELLNQHKTGQKGTSSALQTKSRMDDKLGDNYDLYRDKVAKYIRIAGISDMLMQKLDREEIPFNGAYQLSYIVDKELQDIIAQQSDQNHYKIDIKKTEVLRQYFEAGKLNIETITAILAGEVKKKTKTSNPNTVKIKVSIYQKFFTGGQSKKEVEEIVEQALELYFAQSKDEGGVA